MPWSPRFQTWPHRCSRSILWHCCSNWQGRGLRWHLGIPSNDRCIRWIRECQRQHWAVLGWQWIGDFFCTHHFLHDPPVGGRCYEVGGRERESNASLFVVNQTDLPNLQTQFRTYLAENGWDVSQMGLKGDDIGEGSSESGEVEKEAAVAAV